MRRMRATAIATALIALSGCAGTNSLPKVTTADILDSESTIAQLDEAKNIRLEKAFLSFGDSWDVLADGEKVGTIKGQPIYAIGDTYSMFTNKGNLVASEGEQFRMLNHRAELFNHSNQPAGSIEQRLTLLMLNLQVKDVNGSIIGSAEQKLALNLAANIKDTAGNTEYTVNKEFLSIGAKLNLERKVPNPKVGAVNAIWTAVIMNEVSESSASSGNSGNKGGSNR